jgi:hypothetical protein
MEFRDMLDLLRKENYSEEVWHYVTEFIIVFEEAQDSKDTRTSDSESYNASTIVIKDLTSEIKTWGKEDFGNKCYTCCGSLTGNRCDYPTDDKCGGHNTKEGRKNRNAAFVERVKFFPPNEKKEKESKESNAMNADTTLPVVEEDTISFPWDYKNTSSSSYACSTKVEQQESTYESVESNDAPKEAIYDNVEIHKLTKDKNDQDKVHNKEYEIRGGMPTRDNDDYNCHGLPKSKIHEKDAYAIYGEQKKKSP